MHLAWNLSQQLFQRTRNGIDVSQVKQKNRDDEACGEQYADQKHVARHLESHVEAEQCGGDEADGHQRDEPAQRHRRTRARPVFRSLILMHFG